MQPSDTIDSASTLGALYQFQINMIYLHCSRTLRGWGSFVRRWFTANTRMSFIIPFAMKEIKKDRLTQRWFLLIVHLQ